MAVLDLRTAEVSDNLFFSPVPNGTNSHSQDGIEAEIMACLIHIFQSRELRVKHQWQSGLVPSSLTRVVMALHMESKNPVSQELCVKNNEYVVWLSN